MSNVVKKKRIFYFDALRALAILSVIMIHAFNTSIEGHHAFYSGYPSISWFLSTFFGNYTRIGVDLFLMLSGALSLGRDWDIRTFLGKRIPRIVLPFLFWGFVLSVGMVAFSYAYPDSFTTITTFNLSSFLDYLLHSYLADNTGFTPYWFFWMILGTYLIMPIYNKWLQHCDMKEVEYFLAIWLIVTFATSFDIFFPVKLSYFTGAIGVVVLGYYLRHSERKIYKNPFFIVALLVLSFLLLTAASFEFTVPSEFHKLNRYHIIIIMEVIGVFLLFKNFSSFFPKARLSERWIVKKPVSLLAKYSYGLYLIHRVFIIILYYLLGITNHVYSVVIMLFILATLVSTFVMGIFDHIPYVNRVIGSK